MTNQQLLATTDAKSERRLARSLGYPKSWHVVRSLISHPSCSSTSTYATVSTGTSTTAKMLVQDRIFAGDPAYNSDLYCSHGAAFEAASRWVEGESTPYDDEGGQMLPREAKYKKGQDIQVLYDDGKWYNAKITRVAVYPDDIRYTALYTKENTYQNNVTEDQMRLRPRAKRAAGAPTSGKKSNKKRSAGDVASAALDASQADPEGLELAREIGLPNGWTACVKKNRYTIYSPGRSNRFASKKAAFVFLGVEAQPAKKKARTVGRSRKGGKAVTEDAMEEEEEDGIVEESSDIEEGDPPWRLKGHEYLQRRVQFQREDGIVQVGTIIGWIADTDVDKEGEPGFISDMTDKPACLFHVKFGELAGGSEDHVVSQDLEEYEFVDHFVEVGSKQEHAAQAPAPASALPRADLKETTAPVADAIESTEHK